MRFAGLSAAAVLVLGLAACSGGQGAAPLYPQLLSAAQESIAQKRTRKASAERPPLTRAALNDVQGAYIEVTLERSGIFAYLFHSAERRDDSPGRVVQWRTEDNVTLSLRNGVLIATRGLGGDVVSSAVNVGDGVTGPAGGGQKVHYIRTGDLSERRLALACDLRDLGPETIEIVELRYSVRHLQEDCTAAEGGRVVNDYWVDSRKGIVWKSRQWAGPHIGYLRIRRLTE